MTIYVLTATHGEYSDRSSWVEGVFTTSERAHQYILDRPLDEGHREWLREWAPIDAAQYFQPHKPMWSACSKDFDATGWAPYDGEIDWTVTEWTPA